MLEAVLCRGDRRVGRVIEEAWRAGARLDAWDEYWDWAKWQSAFAAAGVDPAFYAHREIAVDELTPWSHVTDNRSTEFLLAEYKRMMEEAGP